MYIYLAHEATHDTAGGGVQAPLETVARYDSKIVNDTYKVDAACVTELDWSVGNVTMALAEAGVWDNTVLLFMTDNGTVHFFL
jgi:arylsulfatase B/arylsulfatase I/J